MAKVSRRKFLKMMAAGSAGVLGASAIEKHGMFIHPDYEVLAQSDAPEEVKYSHCVMCNHMPKCGVKAIVKDNKIYRIEKREGYGNNLLCAKGIASMQEIYDPHRLLHPMKRTNAKGEPAQWEQITWDEALSTIAEKLNGIKEKYGAEKVLFLTGDPKEPRAILQRLAFTFGSPNMGTESSTCYFGTELTMKLMYGPEVNTAKALAGGANPVAGKTKVAIFWGTNPTWSTPFAYNGLKTAEESDTIKYIIVDPRVTPSVHSFADVHCQIRPGTDGALAHCFANYLIENDAYDHDMAENWIHGFEEYKEYVKQFTISETAKICQIEESVIQDACDLLKNAGGPITIKSAAAFPHHHNGVNNYRAIMGLIPLTGSLDVPGGHGIAPEPLNFTLFAGTPEFSRTTDLFEKVNPLRIDTEYFPAWANIDHEGGNIQINPIPEYVESGAIKAAFGIGVNCMMWPQSDLYQKAFKEMEFVVCADFHYRPQTHDYVDMILPAAMSFERMAPLAVFGRKIFMKDPIVEPQGEARSDWQLCCDVGCALGFEKEFWGGGREGEEAAIREVLRTSNTGVTLEQLREASPEGVAVPLKGEAQSRKWELGLLREDGKPGFTTPTGKIEFYSEYLKEQGMEPLPVYIEPVQSPISTPDLFKEYPLVMNSGSRVPFYTHSKQRDMPWLNQFMPEPVVRIHPTDAEARGIQDGDTVILTSTVKREITVKAEVTEIVKPGVIDIFHGWDKANVNLLITRDFDPISGFPPYKEGLCEVRKA